MRKMPRLIAMKLSAETSGILNISFIDLFNGNFVSLVKPSTWYSTVWEKWEIEQCHVVIIDDTEIQHIYVSLNTWATYLDDRLNM